MSNILSPRRVITNRKGIADGSLEVINQSQVNELATANDELEKDHIDIISVRKKEKEKEKLWNLTKPRIQSTRDLNSFLKVSTKSSIKKALDDEKSRTQETESLYSSLKLSTNYLVEKADGLELKVGKIARMMSNIISPQRVITNKKDIADGSQQGPIVIELQSQVSELSTVVDQLAAEYPKRYFIELNEMKDKYDEEVKRNFFLEDNNHIIVNKEDATSKCLAKAKRDIKDSLFQLDKTIDKLKEELTASKGAIIRLEKNVQYIDERNNDKGNVQLITRQLEEQKSETINLRKKLDKKEEEVNKLIARDIESVTQLEQKNTKIERISTNNEKNRTHLKQKEADFELIIQKHQIKLLELDNMQEKYDAEIERFVKKEEDKD